ncbi:hypothetical protein [Alloactinosynnema sp. L-07]|nr:hypothetical protein [Alloactinosynnema sp. L-07]
MTLAEVRSLESARPLRTAEDFEDFEQERCSACPSAAPSATPQSLTRPISTSPD